MLTSNVEDGCLRIVLEVSSFDASNAGLIKERFKELASADGVTSAEIDLSAVEFVDSSGIGALLGFYKRMEQRLALKNPQPSVVSVLELLRLHRVFKIV